MTTISVEQAAGLRKPFPPEAVGKLPKPLYRDSQKGNCPECHGHHGMPAVHLDYVGHAAVTDRLLSVDPAWSWEPLALDENGLPALDRRGNLWIRLTICGVTRIGVGDGGSAKECIGDAIRNAAMRFGVALDLWSKEELEQSQGPASPPPFTEHGTSRPQTSGAEDAPDTHSPSAQRPDSSAPESAPITSAQLTKIGILCGELGLTDAAKARDKVGALIGREIKSRKDLTKSEAHHVIEQFTYMVEHPFPDDEPIDAEVVES